MCTELDILEGNRVALQSAIHTERGGEYGSGRCDVAGCIVRVGGPSASLAQRDNYGPGKRIDTALPFEVRASVDATGVMKISLRQGMDQVTR